MEGSSWHEEEKSVSFYPCCFLEEALRALLRCLGIGSEKENTECSQQKEDRTSLLVPPSGAADPININSPCNTQDAPDPSSITNQSINTSSLANSGSRRSGISRGSGPGHN